MAKDRDSFRLWFTLRILINIKPVTHRKFGNQKSNDSRTDIDHVFVDNSRPNLLSTASIRSGLSDNDDEILTIRNIYATIIFL